MTVAPAHVCVIPLSVGDDYVAPEAQRLADALTAAGLEVVVDDRKDRPGVKFNDADLIGWPVQIVVGKRGLDEGNFEVKVRATGEKKNVATGELYERIAAFAQGTRAPEDFIAQVIE